MNRVIAPLLALLSIVFPAMALASGHALLIGASTSPEGPALPGAGADVEAMRTLLVESYGYPASNVTMLVGADATRGGVHGALRAMTEATQRGEPVVVYYAGAGALVADANQDEPDPWDEAWLVADGTILDDEVHEHLGALAKVAAVVTYVVDAGTVAEGGVTNRFHARWGGRHTPPSVEISDDDLGVGDGWGGWAAPGPSNLVIVEGARLGAALETKRYGVFTRVLTRNAAKYPTWSELRDRLITKVAARSMQVPGILGATDGLVFGKEALVDASPAITRFELPDGGITVMISEGNRPDQITRKHVRRIQKAIAGDGEVSRRVTVAEDADWMVRRNPAATELEFEIVGPEGAVRNSLAADDLRSAYDKVADTLMLHGQQSALLDMDLPSGPLRVRMLPMEEKEQSPCAGGRWVPAEPNQEQVVPMCWRWQVEVQLGRQASAPAEVGVVVMGNDGTLLGFPIDSAPVVLEPGQKHRFSLQRPGRKPGLVSVPPLDIPEHVLVFGAPVGSNARFDVVEGWAARDVVGDGSDAPEGSWFRSHLPYRVSPTPGRPGELPRDPDARRREVTLNGFDIGPYLPANQQSYLYKVLQQADRLVDFTAVDDSRGRDGLAYAQCWPAGNRAINNKTRFSETDWPGETCWSSPFDFTRDNSELGDSPGIDCSTTMWFVYTRACAGDGRAPLPDMLQGERHSAYQARLREFHTKKRRCLLFTDEDFRGGFVSTNVMANQPELMADHWNSCLGEPLKTGDVLVTRNARNTSGHTYLVVDPDRFVVFGSHAGDTSWSKMTEDERAQWEEFEELDAGALDAGVEYQFLAWHRKSDLVGTVLEKFGGFASERVKACWRHKEIVAEWARDPTSRPGSRDLSRICQPETCR